MMRVSREGKCFWHMFGSILKIYDGKTCHSVMYTIISKVYKQIDHVYIFLVIGRILILSC
jgi:hypothetical protein